MSFLDQSFAETKKWDQTAQLWSYYGVEINQSLQRVITDVIGDSSPIRRISLLISELAKQWSDFRSSKLDL